MPSLTKDFYVPFRALRMPNIDISKVFYGCMRVREYLKLGNIRKAGVYIFYRCKMLK